MYSNFIFDNRSSEEFEVACAYFNNILEEASGGIQTELATESNSDGSIFYIVNNKYSEAINFEVTLVKNVKNQDKRVFEQEEIRAVVSWLCSPSSYRELILEDNHFIELVLNAKFTNPKYTLNGNDVIGITFTGTLDRPYALSNVKQYSFDSSVNTFSLYNDSDEKEKVLYPQEIIITINDDCDVTITNTKENSRLFTQIKNCVSGEVITIDCERRIIKSTNKDVPILSRFNKHWIGLLHGKNIFNVSGSFNIQFNYREVRKVGVY